MHYFKNEILPYLSILISGLAVFFTFIGLRYQRTHNIKSLKPLGRIKIGDFESDIFVSIENVGVGPLIIKKVYLNGKEIDMEKGIIHYIPTSIRENTKWKNFSANYKNRAISSLGTLELLRWTPQTDYEKNEIEIINTKKQIRELLQNWNLKIVYTDIYDSEDFEDTLSMEWFGRHFK